MTSLLIAEPPLQVLPTLACRIGLNEAIVLQQVHYLSLRPSNHDGWVDKELGDWCEVFPFIGRRSLQRAFAGLRVRGLLMVEPVPGGGRRTRVRVDHDTLDALTEMMCENSEVTRQSGATNAPIWRDQCANLARPMRQSGAQSSCKDGTTEGTTEESFALSREREASDEVSLVFTEWQTATGRTDAVLDDKRRRLIGKALKLKPVADLRDAVNGWRHSSWHQGANPDGVVKNDLELLLAGASEIERFANLERHRGDSSIGKVAAPCPDPAGDELLARWAPIAAGLVERVPVETHGIWLSSLHPHADVDGTLIVGAAPEILTWVSDRFRQVLDAAAGGTPVTLVECELVMPQERID